MRNKQQQEIDPTFIILKIDLLVVTSIIFKCGSSNNYCCIKLFPASCCSTGVSLLLAAAMALNNEETSAAAHAPPPPVTTIIPALSAGTKQLDGLWLHTVRGHRAVPDKNSSTGGTILKDFWRCNHCGVEFSGLSITRVKIHLSGEGKGIAFCTKVSNDKSNQCSCVKRF